MSTQSSLPYLPELLIWTKHVVLPCFVARFSKANLGSHERTHPVWCKCDRSELYRTAGKSGTFLLHPPEACALEALRRGSGRGDGT